MPNGYDLNAVEGGIGRGLSRAADRLWELGKEKRAEKAKDKRYQTILGSYRTLLPDVPDEKIMAYVGSAMEGAQLPYSTLQQEKPAPDMGPLFNAFNVPEPLRESLTGFTPAQMVTVITSLNKGKSGVDESVINDMVKEGMITAEMGRKAIAFARFQSVTGMTATTAESIFEFGTDEKVPEWKRKTTRAAAIIGNRTYSELEGKDLAELYALGYTEPEVKEIFGVEGITGTEFFRLQNQIYDSVASFMSPRFGSFYRWKNGEVADTKEEKQQDAINFGFFNKNFDIETGLPKASYVRRVGLTNNLFDNPLTPKIKTYLDLALSAGMTPEQARQEYLLDPPEERGLSAREFELLIAWLKVYGGNGALR